MIEVEQRVQRVDNGIKILCVEGQVLGKSTKRGYADVLFSVREEKVKKQRV